MSADAADRLRVRAPSPEWFQWAIGVPVTSHYVSAEGCAVHYLRWEHAGSQENPRGLLLLHGGGAHANWWRFIAPYFTGQFRVAAMDLSGMGDSGLRPRYSSTLRAAEIAAVLDDAGFTPQGSAAPEVGKPFIIGHSFGGYTSMRYASLHGEDVAGVIIADSPIRPPDQERAHFASRPDVPPERRLYPDFETALSRFRLRPRQTCSNEFIVELIGRHSIKRVPEGWTWKFDPRALGRDRHAEPFIEYLQAMRCRTALMFGEKSALTTPETVAHMRGLMKPNSPVVGIPEGQHHFTLDQPLAFVAAARAILDEWARAER